jgi:YD repeat-containing protein
MLTLCVLSVACSNDPSILSSESNAPTPSLAAAGPGAVRSVTVASFDMDQGLDGFIDRVGVTTVEYDARGNVVSMDQRSENHYGDARFGYLSAREYNLHNDLIAALDQEISDEYVSQTQLITVALNQQGHPVLQALEYDSGGSTDLANQFDARGRLVGQTYDAAETRVYDHDAHDNIVHWTAVTPFSRFEESIEFNAHDAVLGSTLIVTQGSQRMVQTLETTEVDAQGYPTVQTFEVTFRGRLQERDIVRTTYDGHHRPLIEVEDLDTDANGSPDARVTRRFEYRGAEVPVAHGQSALASRLEAAAVDQRLRALAGADQKGPEGPSGGHFSR